MTLQSAITEARTTDPATDVTPLVSRQTDILDQIGEIGRIRVVTQYLVDMHSSMNLPGAAKAVEAAALHRALTLFFDMPRVNPTSDILEVFALLDRSHRQGDPEAARRGLDRIVAVMGSPDEDGYGAGFTITEAGRMLAKWGSREDARRHFARARLFARSRPLHADDGFDTRFMILIHVAQRAWEAGFVALARETLAEAEVLQARAYPDSDDLQEANRILREHFDK